MKCKIIAAICAICLLLSGCSFSMLDGEYVYTQPHEDNNSLQENAAVHARNYAQLYGALAAMVESGQDQGVIIVSSYDKNRVSIDVQHASQQLRKEHPIAAYAVSDISAELGKTGGEDALAVQITYLHDRAEIRQIKDVKGVHQAAEKIKTAIRACDVGIVLMVRDYEAVDFVQIVENFAVQFPEHVIEQPRVTVNVYPDSGTDRVVEVGFSYQNSRDALKEMQSKVQTMFISASLYVSADRQEYDKYFHLQTFMMERFEFKIENSITPAYSLLLHGVGDPRAFATVYAAMCTRENLECHVVNGTRNGEAHTWNILCIDGVYYHVDLLRNGVGGEFVLLYDHQMDGYVCHLANHGGAEHHL